MKVVPRSSSSYSEAESDLTVSKKCRGPVVSFGKIVASSSSDFFCFVVTNSDGILGFAPQYGSNVRVDELVTEKVTIFSWLKAVEDANRP